MYDPLLVQPMREELSKVGFEELTTPEEVDNAMNRPGTTFVVVNSVCGCAAGAARPAARIAIQHGTKPDHFVTVFAGQDKEAVQHLRDKYLAGQPPSSPSMAILQDGKLLGMLHRYQIEGNSAQTIAEALTNAFDKYCAKEAQSNS